MAKMLYIRVCTCGGVLEILVSHYAKDSFKAAYSVTMNIFRKIFFSF